MTEANRSHMTEANRSHMTEVNELKSHILRWMKSHDRGKWAHRSHIEHNMTCNGDGRWQIETEKFMSHMYGMHKSCDEAHMSHMYGMHKSHDEAHMSHMYGMHKSCDEAHMSHMSRGPLPWCTASPWLLSSLWREKFGSAELANWWLAFLSKVLQATMGLEAINQIP